MLKSLKHGYPPLRQEALPRYPWRNLGSSTARGYVACARRLWRASVSVGSVSHRQACSELCELPDTGHLPGLSRTSCVGKRTTTTILSVLTDLWHEKKWKTPVSQTHCFAEDLLCLCEVMLCAPAGTNVFGRNRCTRSLVDEHTRTVAREEFFNFLQRLQ